MFERYDEPARRSVFFARYEASVFGSSWIEPQHLLLGILREDSVLRGELPAGAVEQIRKEVERRSPPSSEHVSTSGDLPLSRPCQSALRFASEEAEALQQVAITPGHLVLGLLRVEDCMAAGILQEFGIAAARYRKVLERYPVRRAEQPSPRERSTLEKIAAAAPSLEDAVNRLLTLLNNTSNLVRPYPDTYGEQKLKRKPWTRKQALGHLIDWAAAHQQWFARALSESTLLAGGYPEENWVLAERYADFAWQDTLDLWVSLNRLLLHVLAGIPEEKLKTPCRIGISQPVPLSQLIARYVEHCEDIAGQIVAHL